MSRLLVLLDRLLQFLLDRLVRSVLDRLHPRKVLRAVGDAAQHPTPVLRVRASPRVARFHHRSRSLGSQPGIQPDKTPRA